MPIIIPLVEQAVLHNRVELHQNSTTSFRVIGSFPTKEKKQKKHFFSQQKEVRK